MEIPEQVLIFLQAAGVSKSGYLVVIQWTWTLVIYAVLMFENHIIIMCMGETPLMHQDTR